MFFVTANSFFTSAIYKDLGKSEGFLGRGMSKNFFHDAELFRNKI